MLHGYITEDSTSDAMYGSTRTLNEMERQRDTILNPVFQQPTGKATQITTKAVVTSEDSDSSDEKVVDKIVDKLSSSEDDDRDSIDTIL